jgi:hypothetical protein
VPLTRDYLKSILNYDPSTGKWIWKRFKAGVQYKTEAGSKSRYYRKIVIDGTGYFCANLAWLYMTGTWPEKEVDHKNRDGFDDRWENLRLATHIQNMTNRIQKSKKNGLPVGVRRHGKRYEAFKTINNKYTYLGMFSSIEEAHSAYLKATEDVIEAEFLPQDWKGPQ